MSESTTTQEKNEPIKKKRSWIKWIKISLISLFSFLFLSLLMVYLFQDQIIQKSLKAFNKGIYGEITIGATSLAPFENFPYLSILVEDIEILDSTGTNKLFELKELYIGIHTMKAIKGVYEVKKIKIDKGYVNIVSDENETLNLAKAFTFYEVKEEEEIDTSSTKISAQVNLELIDFDVYYTDEKTEDYYAIKIPHFETDLDMEDSLVLDVVSFEMYPLKIQEYDWTTFELHPLKLESSIQLNLDKSDLNLEELELSIGESELNITGRLNYEGLMPADLKIVFETIDVSIIKPFLPGHLHEELEDLEVKDASKISVEVKGDLQGDFAIKAQQKLHFTSSSSNDLYQIQNFDLIVRADIPNINQLNSAQIYLDTLDLKKGNQHLAMNAHLSNLDTLLLNKFQAKINLELGELYQWTQQKELQGAKGTIALTTDLEQLYLSQASEKIVAKVLANRTQIVLNELEIKAPGTPHTIKHLNAKIGVYQDVLDVEDLSLKIKASDLTLNTNISGITSFITGKNTPVKGDVRLDSKHLSFDELLAYDTALHASYSDILDHLHLNFSFATTYQQLMNFELAPEGVYEIKNLELTPTHYKHHIHHFNTKVIVENDEIKIPSFKGKINDSDIAIALNIKGSKGLINAQHQKPLKIDLTVNSDHLIFGDFATYNGQAMLDDEYMKEHISNLDFTLELETEPLNFSDNAPLLPNTKLKLHDVHAKFSYHTLEVEDINLDVEILDENIDLKNFSFKIGESDLTMLAYLEKPLDWTEDNLNRNKERIEIKSKKLNLDELMAFAHTEPEVGSNEAHVTNSNSEGNNTKGSEEEFDITQLPFPEATASLTIDELIADGARFNSINVALNSTKDRLVELRNFTFGIDEGKVIIERSRIEADKTAAKEYFVFNAKDRDDIFARGKIKLYKLSSDDLEKSLGPIMVNMYEELGLEEFRGQLMDNIILNKLTFNPDLSLKMDEMVAFPHVELAPLDNEKAVKLVGFQALEMLKDYFKSYDIKKFELGSINLNFKVKEGELLFTHSIKIQTSIGPIQIQKDSYYKLDLSEMNMIYQIPGKIVSRAVMGTLFGNKKNDKSKVEDSEVLKPYYIHFIMKGDDMYTKIYTSRVEVNELNEKRADLGEEKFFKKYIKI